MKLTAYYLLDLDRKVLAVAFEVSFQRAIETLSIVSPYPTKAITAEFILSEWEAVEATQWDKELVEALSVKEDA